RNFHISATPSPLARLHTLQRSKKQNFMPRKIVGSVHVACSSGSGNSVDDALKALRKCGIEKVAN
ncbi:unnamed protein product, partial [Ceratitis capitata]